MNWNNVFRSVALWLSLVATLISHARATTYYIRTDGDNANKGVQDSPIGAWRDLTEIDNRRFLPGDVVIVKPGTYKGRHPENGLGVLIRNLHGSARSPITIKCATRRACILDAIEDGDRSPRIEGSSGSSDAPVHPAHAARLFGVVLLQNAWMNFDGFVVQDAFGNGLHANSNSNVTISNCEFRWNGWASADSTRHSGLYVNELSPNMTLINNFSHHNGNSRTSVGGHGFYVQSGSLLFVNNIASENTGYGLQINADAPIKGVDVFNNAFYNNRKGGLVLYSGGGIAATFADIEVKNNIFMNNRGYGVEAYDAYFRDGGADVTLSANIGFGNSSGNATSFGDRGKQISRGIDWISNDPLFTKASEGVFTVQTGSPAIDAGIPLPQSSPDYHGVERPLGEAITIGPLEYRKPTRSQSPVR